MERLDLFSNAHWDLNHKISVGQTHLNSQMNRGFSYLDGTNGSLFSLSSDEGGGEGLGRGACFIGLPLSSYPLPTRSSRGEEEKPVVLRKLDASALTELLPRLAFWTSLLLVASSCVFSGCRSVVMMAPVNLTESGWRVRNGQVVWRPQRRAPELAGDLMIASHPDGRSVVQFTKTPLPIVVAQTSARSWLIAFVPAKRELSGKMPAPVRFVWLYLDRILVAGHQPPAHWTVQWLDGGNRWRVENRRTGETLEGYLKP